MYTVKEKAGGGEAERRVESKSEEERGREESDEESEVLWREKDWEPLATQSGSRSSQPSVIPLKWVRVWGGRGEGDRNFEYLRCSSVAC